MSAQVRALCGLVVVFGCKAVDDPPAAPPQPPPSPAPVDAAATDWIGCETALRGAAKLPATRRVQAVLDGCTPCGEWAPLLAWDIQPVDGGPARATIERAMVACNAYCDPNAKARFLGALDAARGRGTRGPWRLLGEACKAAVSAVPDARYMSAPYFALDRIARAAAARPELAPLLDGLEIALPAVSISGSGLELANSPVTSPELGPLALTVTATELRLAMTPRARLGRDGVAATTTGELYPGALVATPNQLAAVIATLIPSGAPGIAMFAPRGMLAVRLLDALAVTKARETKLAVAATGGPPGWPLAGTIPIALTSTVDPEAVTIRLDETPDAAIKQAMAVRALLARGVTIEIARGVRVAALAKLLGAMLYFDVGTVAIRKAR